MRKNKIPHSKALNENITKSVFASVNTIIVNASENFVKINAKGRVTERLNKCEGLFDPDVSFLFTGPKFENASKSYQDVSVKHFYLIFFFPFSNCSNSS